MTDKTVLLVSRHFPPDFAVGGKRAWRFARHLRARGWQPVILTSAVSRNKAIDTSFGELPDVRVIRSYHPSWWPEDAPAQSDGTVAGATSFQAGSPSLWQRLKAATRTPIGKDLWLAPRMSRHIAAVATQVGATALWVTSSPYTATVFGVDAARRAGLPLVLDLRDPWTLNFMARETSWQRRWEQQTEARVLAAADRVVLTCEAAAEAYRARYPQLPAGHIRTIYNSFDPAMTPPSATPSPPDKLRIVHFGSCYGPRRADTLLRAIARLRDEQGVSPGCFELLNLGRVAAEDVALCAELGLQEVLRHRVFVPYHEGVELLAGADLLLLLAYGEETLYIPAKLFDYLLARRPILAIAAPSELTSIIDRAKVGNWVRPADVQTVAEVLHRSLETKQRGVDGFTADRDVVDAFSAPQTTAQLAALLDELVD